MNERAVGRRGFLSLAGLVLGTVLGGCLERSAPVAASETATPPPLTPSSPAAATPESTPTIEPAPLVAYEAPGFSFAYPANWEERPTEDDTLLFEYTAEGYVLGTLRAWSALNTLYDSLSEAETATREGLAEGDHAVLDARSVELADGREGRVVEYRLAGSPVRGASVVSLAGPWVLRLIVLVHEDAYTERVARTIEATLHSLAYTG